MLRYLIRRAGNMFLVLFGLILFVFSLLRLAPGNPVDMLLGEDVAATPEARAALEAALHLDKPLPTQFFFYVYNIFKGDFGESIRLNQPTLGLFLERLPATLELAAVATLLMVMVSIPIGVVVALRRNTAVDYIGTSLTLIGISMPGFWLGMMLILLFAVDLGWAASSGRGDSLISTFGALFMGNPTPLWTSIRHIALPAITLSAFGMAFLTRMMRSNLQDELNRGYVRAAEARGLPFSMVVAKHALRNALLPVVTVLGLELGTLIGGAIIIETVFSWPGVGQLIYQAINARDYPLAQTGILIVGSLVVLLTLLVDVLYAWLDPRIRLG